MWIGWLEFDLLLGDVHSLKEKRSVVRPIVAELQRRFAVSAAETGTQDLHRRAGIEQGVQLGRQVVEYRADQLLLAPEMSVHQTVVDLRPGRDVADRRGRRPPLGEQFRGRGEYRRGNLVPPRWHVCRHSSTLAHTTVVI